MWLIILSSSIGYILPSPGLKFKKQSTPSSDTDSEKSQTMKEFYLTLLSDSSLNTFANNKQSSFTVRLDHPIQIDKDNWEVGLFKIITPSEVKNVTDKNNFFYLRFFDKILSSKLDVAGFEPTCNETGTCLDMKLKVPTGYYSTPTGRCSSIGSVFAWHASGPEFDPHVRHILSWRLGHENISTAILPLPLIQEEQLSLTGERMCTKYW